MHPLRVLSKGNSRSPIVDRFLYLVTDGAQLRRTSKLISSVEMALRVGGSSIFAVQLREQTGSDPATNDELRLLISELHPLCRLHGVALLVNSNLEIARECGVEGLHLGARSMSVVDARKILGPDACVGYSAHSIEEGQRAANDGANYIFLSPIFSPLSKADSRPPLGTEYLSHATSLIPVPIFALGGITALNIPLCRRAGAAGVATLTTILLAPDIPESTKAAVAAWHFPQ